MNKIAPILLLLCAVGAAVPLLAGCPEDPKPNAATDAGHAKADAGAAAMVDAGTHATADAATNPALLPSDAGATTTASDAGPSTPTSASDGGATTAAHPDAGVTAPVDAGRHPH